MSPVLSTGARNTRQPPPPAPGPQFREYVVKRGDTPWKIAARLLDDVGVVVTPGVGYGAAGEGYVRLSLTIPDDRLEEALRRLRGWKGVTE